MQDQSERVQMIVAGIIENGILPNLRIDNDVAYTVDPVYDIKRNRVNAECVKAMLRVNDKNGCYHPEIIEKLLRQLVSKQAVDGSWNEIHVKYDHPSALITAIVGEALLDGFVRNGNNDLEPSIHLAKDYVVKNEISPGYFRKSSVYVADHLNVDATCGAFLAKYGKVFSDTECLDVARRTADHICKHQFENGAFPYTNETRGNYHYDMQIPCIHYQGVTLYYLLKIIDALETEDFDSSILKGVDWLASTQLPDGRFNWSKSGLMFAYCLSGAYAFAVPCFLYAGRWDSKYTENADKALSVLEQNVNGIVNRWESASMWSFPSSVLTAAKTAGIGDYPLKHRCFRFGYGMYRQFARRRFSKGVNPRLFNLLASTMGIEASTVEPDNNFPDLFMTSEVLDCLSYSISKFNYDMVMAS